MVSNPFGGGLSVRISANSRDFTRGVENAQDSLRDFAGMAVGALGPLQGLQGRADEAGDELADVGRESSQASRRLAALSGAAATTGGTFSALAFSTEGLSLSFGSLTTSLSGTVLLLGVVGTAATGLLSTLVPLAAIVGTMTAGVGALAGAFGAVLGIPLITHFKGLQTYAKSVAMEIEGILEPLGDELLPLLTDTLDALPALVENIIDAIGGFDVFTDALRDFGAVAFRVIPQLTAFMFDLARRALPVVRDFFGWLLRNGGAIFGAMLRTTQRLAPVFMRFLDTLINAAPEINQLGTQILQIAIPALSTFIGFVEDVIQLGAQSDSFVGFIRNAVDALVSWVQGPGKAKISSVVQSIKDALTALLGGDPDDSLLSAFTGFVSGLLDRVATWMKGGGKTQIENLLTSLFDSMASVLTGKAGEFNNKILDPLITILSGLFDALTNALMSDEAGALGTAIGDFVGALGAIIGQRIVAWFSSGEFLSFAGRIIGAIVTGLGSALGGLVGGFGREARGGEPPGFRPVSEGPIATGFASTFGGNVSATAPGRGGQQIEITGTLTTEDGEVVALIDDRVAANNSREARRVFRNLGETP